MGKKRGRTAYTSKGERNNVSKSTLGLMKRSRDGFEKEAGKLLAWTRGLNPWVTVKNNTNVSGTNRPFYKVRANDVWGDPKRRGANLFNCKGSEDE